ncbi:MAG: helix-turn-helix transcriptional regulator [Bacilli bacterium]|nr:helix-turn-helix transcriptional regulator [Bacilli bacterium]
MSIVDELIAERKRLGLTQAELGERCGMKQAAIARIEAKRVSPTIATLSLLCEALGLDLALIHKGEQR